MPRLIEYISIGFCSGYQDGDFRVSMKVQDLSRERLDELKLVTLTALRVADEAWLRAQHDDMACQKKQAVTESTHD